MSESRKYPFPDIDADICKGCGLCIEACPTNVLITSEKLNSKGFHYAEYIGEGCVGCGNCFYTCPEPSAIAVYLKDYIPGEVS